MHPSTLLFTYPSIHHPFINNPSIDQSSQSITHSCIHPHTNPSIYSPPTHTFFYYHPSTYLSVHLIIHPSTHTFPHPSTSLHIYMTSAIHSPTVCLPICSNLTLQCQVLAFAKRTPGPIAVSGDKDWVEIGFRSQIQDSLGKGTAAFKARGLCRRDPGHSCGTKHWPNWCCGLPF